MHELTGSFVTETLSIDSLVWQFVRMFVVMLAMGVRFYLFRDELQFRFDQSYYIIHKLMQSEVEKTENAILYVRQRVTQNFMETWQTVFQQASTFMMPVLLVICSLHRILSFSNLDKKVTEFDFSETIQKLRDSQSVYSEETGNVAEPYNFLQDKD